MSRPSLIVITGHPGSGKSTLAEHLGRRIHLPVLSRDELKEGYVQTRRAPHIDLEPDVNRVVTQTFFDAMAVLLERDISLIVEAAFQHGIWAPALERMRERAVVAVVICRVDRILARQRRQRRFDANPMRWFAHGEKRPDDPAELPAVQGGGYQPPELPVPTLTVDMAIAEENGDHLATIVGFLIAHDLVVDLKGLDGRDGPAVPERA